MKTKRLLVFTLAALMVCGSASANGFRKGGVCKKCRMEQRFRHGKQFRGKKCIRFEKARFDDPRFRDPRFFDQKSKDLRFRDVRFDKKHVHKRHHRR